MSQGNNPFQLPRRKEADAGCEIFQPKSFRFWIETLPVGNLTQAAKDIHQQLKVMNRYEIPPLNRLENLEQILPQLLLVLGDLSSGHIPALYPEGKNNRHNYSRDISLLTLIIQGYKIVLEHFHHESIAGHLLHKHKRGIAVHRVAYFLGRTLLHTYQHYQPEPSNLWQEYHGLYHYALHHHLSTIDLENEDKLLVDSLTMTELYKQALLLSLADPYHLKQGEAGHIYVALKRWAKHCQLQLLKEDTATGTFIITMGQDTPPIRADNHQRLTDNEQWGIETDNLISQMIDELATSQTQSGAIRPHSELEMIEPALLTRLMLSWGGGGKRTSSRSEISGDIAITFGFNALYTLLEGEELPELSSSDITVNTLTTRAGNSTNRLPRDQYFIEDGPDLSKQKSTTPQVINEDSQIDVKNQGFVRNCMVHDVSDHGFHLGWIGKGDSGVRVGELVGASQTPDHPTEHLQLCVVRWMRLSKPGLLDFGIEILPETLEPVVIRILRENPLEQSSFRGFAQIGESEITSIIMPPFYASETPEMELVKAGITQRITLDRVIESTGSFIQFSFLQVKPTDTQKEQGADNEATELTEEQETESSDQFDSLWKSL